MEMSKLCLEEVLGVFTICMVFLDVCGDQMYMGGLSDYLSHVEWRIHTVLA